MEETIWIVAGIIAIIITIGAITGIVNRNQLENKKIYSEQSLNSLLGMCNKMCIMPEESYLPVSVKLASGTVLSSNNESICIESKDSKSCRRCDCKTSNYVLNLSNPEAEKLFSTHNYECFFLKKEGMLRLECKG
jgi:hypothetical protein